MSKSLAADFPMLGRAHNAVLLLVLAGAWGGAPSVMAQQVANTPLPGQTGGVASAQLLNDQLRRYFGALSEIEYSGQYGMTMNLGLQSSLSENANALVLGRFGAKQKGVLAGLGVGLLPDLRLNLLGEHLQQKRHFTAGDEDYWVAQNKFGLGLQWLPQSGPAKVLGVRYTYAHSPDKNLVDTTQVTETAALYEKFLVQNRFVGTTTQELQAEAVFDVGQQGELAIFGGPAHRRSNDGVDTVNRLSGGTRFNWYTGEGRLALGVQAIAERTETTLSYEGALGGRGASWLLGLTSVSGMHGHNDTIAGLSINLPLGDGLRRTAFNRPSRGSFAALDSSLREAARQFRTTVVSGQEKEISRTRTIAIVKTGLPAGSSVAANGIITVPLGVVVTGIAGITLNGGAFTNSGQFAVSGSSLTVNPNNITQPAAGATDSYVVTANNAGGGTTNITINVQKGSVKIVGISVVAGSDTTAPTLTSSATLSSSNIGALASHVLTFDENLGAATIGALPTGMTATVTTSGATATLQISTTASFTGFGAVSIPLIVTDTANNSRSVTLTKTIADVAPSAAGAFATLADMTINDNGGAIPTDINAGGAVDSLGRTVVYSATGLPVGMGSINTATGVITWSGDLTSNTSYNVTVTAKAQSGTATVSKAFVLSVLNNF